MNIEQIKQKIAEAIENRIDPPTPKARAKYHLWIDTNSKRIGCGWATILRLQKWQRIVYTFLRNPDDGFTPAEWEDMAERFSFYFR